MTAPFPNPDPQPTQLAAALRQANAVALRAMAQGQHPFGALLLAPDHVTVLAEQGNVDTVNHAEAVLLRAMAAAHGSDFLWGCTLVTTFEPCAMCAATGYWANVGRVAYGAGEDRLLELTGAHPENPTLALPCRELFARGQKPVRVFGPFPELEAELIEPHRLFWTTR